MDAPRFVILHHVDIARPHYDLMFQQANQERLTTFRVPHWPITSDTPVERLEDHRADYLCYEGPVSNNRGWVRRVAAGRVELLSVTESRFQITLRTETETIHLDLTRNEGSQWLAAVNDTPRGL